MNAFLRAYAAWKYRRKPAQIIVIDGAAEIAASLAFLKGGLAGMGMALLLFAVMAPSTVSPAVVEEMARREALVHEARERSEQATALVHACLRTAEGMEQTLASYQKILRTPGT